MVDDRVDRARRSRRWRRVAASPIIVLPVVLGLDLVFGGGRVNGCLGGNACHEAITDPGPDLRS